MQPLRHKISFRFPLPNRTKVRRPCLLPGSSKASPFKPHETLRERGFLATRAASLFLERAKERREQRSKAREKRTAGRCPQSGPLAAAVVTTSRPGVAESRAATSSSGGRGSPRAVVVRSPSSPHAVQPAARHSVSAVRKRARR